MRLSYISSIPVSIFINNNTNLLEGAKNRNLSDKVYDVSPSFALKTCSSLERDFYIRNSFNLIIAYFRLAFTLTKFPSFYSKEDLSDSLHAISVIKSNADYSKQGFSFSKFQTNSDNVSHWGGEKRFLSANIVYPSSDSSPYRNFESLLTAVELLNNSREVQLKSQT
jgi:hypothetical protein